VRVVQETWRSVDDYISRTLVGEDPALVAASEATAEAGLPPIAVAPNQGKFLHLLARVRRARNILEIGTLGGYSTIWLARALPAGGRLISLEVNPAHAEVARANIARAGVGAVVQILVGPAIETLPKLAADGAGPFDLVFIDADKPSTPEYVTWAIELSLPGTVIVVDNVVRAGRIVEDVGDAAVEGIRRANEILAADARVDATAIQTVGVKGYDGFAVALVS
jgi:predicted O-methyltransferase YrrM